MKTVNKCCVLLSSNGSEELSTFSFQILWVLGWLNAQRQTLWVWKAGCSFLLQEEAELESGSGGCCPWCPGFCIAALPSSAHSPWSYDSEYPSPSHLQFSRWKAGEGTLRRRLVCPSPRKQFGDRMCSFSFFPRSRSYSQGHC